MVYELWLARFSAAKPVPTFAEKRASDATLQRQALDR
jgi:hypothetical protein